MKIKIFADGANEEEMLKVYHQKIVTGFTTNPSLMKKAGVKDYKGFAKRITSQIPDLPISFEVFSDDLNVMIKEARIIGSLGNNVYVKIPITNTKGISTAPVIHTLSSEGIKVNVTAVFTPEQTKTALNALSPDISAIISVFAGRISDTGINPVPIMKKCKEYCGTLRPHAELLWASCRELYSIYEAEESGCDIITVPNAILTKLPLIGKDLTQYSLETVRGFFADASSLGFTIIS